jgi:hypothetical protein
VSAADASRRTGDATSQQIAANAHALPSTIASGNPSGSPSAPPSNNDVFWRCSNLAEAIAGIQRETGVRRETIARYDPHRHAKAQRVHRLRGVDVRGEPSLSRRNMTLPSSKTTWGIGQD